MILRAIPLTICLAWLAYESHFSPSFFVSTLETGLVSIAEGIEGAVGFETPPRLRTVMARTGGV